MKKCGVGVGVIFFSSTLCIPFHLITWPFLQASLDNILFTILEQCVRNKCLLKRLNILSYRSQFFKLMMVCWTVSYNPNSASAILMQQWCINRIHSMVMIIRSTTWLYWFTGKNCSLLCWYQMKWQGWKTSVVFMSHSFIKYCDDRPYN